MSKQHSRRGNGEGCIRHLPNGYWEARVTIGYNEKGKQRFKTFNGKTRQIVIGKMRAYNDNVKDNMPENACKFTLSYWLDVWYEQYVIPNVKMSTRVSYEMIIRQHIKPNLGHIRLQDLRKDKIEEVYSFLLRSGKVKGCGGLSPKTVKNIHLVLQKSLDEAVVREYIIKNPAKIAKVPSLRSANCRKHEIQILTIAEQKVLTQACGDDCYGIGIKLILNTGLRLGELLGLQWSDIDFEKRTLQVSRQVNRLKDFSENSKMCTILGIQDSVKTMSSNRYISLSPGTIEMLFRYKEQQTNDIKKWGRTYKNMQMVFAREDGYYIDPSTFRSHYKKTLQCAGLGNITIHALRHTFATRALEANIPIKVVSDILGHAGVQITMDTYSHVLPQLHDEAILKFDEYINQSFVNDLQMSKKVSLQH